MRSSYHPETIDHFLDSRLYANRLTEDLSPEAALAFEALKQTGVFPAGVVVFAEGLEPQGVYVLNQGSAKLVLSPGSKRAQIIRVAEPGEVLGLSATIAGEPYEVTLETITPCRTDFIPRDDFLRFLHEHPDACFRVVELLGRNLHESYEQFRLFERSPSAAAKLAQVLLNWCEGYEETDEGIRLHIPLTHEGIARMIGTSRETVTRAFGELKNRRIISLKGSELLVRDKIELKRLSEPAPHALLPT